MASDLGLASSPLLRWLKEPLLHFLLIGAGLFVVFYQVGDSTAARSDSIVVSADDIQRMTALWSRRWQRPPTSAELEGLIQSRIREEVLYREARALGLERDDTIVRRRMAQKMEFLIEDLAPRSEPTEADLQVFLKENTERFQESGRFSFMHVYLSVDQRGDQALPAAQLLLDDLGIQGKDADPVLVSDSFALGYRFEDHSERDVARLLGQAFADSLADLPVKQWQGPIESAYGIHLVYVHERTVPRVPALAEIRDRVRSELLAKRQRAANEAMFRELKSRYEIRVEQPEPAQISELATGTR